MPFIEDARCRLVEETMEFHCKEDLKLDHIFSKEILFFATPPLLT